MSPCHQMKWNPRLEIFVEYQKIYIVFVYISNNLNSALFISYLTSEMLNSRLILIAACLVAATTAGN